MRQTKQKDDESRENYFEVVGKAFVPKRFRPNLRAYLAKAGIAPVPYKFFTIMFFVALLITYILFFASGFWTFLSTQPTAFIGIGTFIFWFFSVLVLSAVIMGGIYFYINMKIYNRVKLIEENLPDYLVLVSTNLKGGLSFEKALWASIKPEFGVLAAEMSIVSKRVLTGSDLKEALLELSQKFESPTMRRTINIIIGQIESGGEVAKILDQIIDNLRKTRIIKEEMSANTLMFTIFIAAIVVVISPLLFALAYNILSILVSVSQQIAPALENSASNSPFSFSEIKIDKEEFKLFSIFALSIISIFASMILSNIQRGDIKSGLKYMPFFIAAGVFLYFFFLLVLQGVFGIFAV